jgi:hypothetical protein
MRLADRPATRYVFDHDRHVWSAIMTIVIN